MEIENGKYLVTTGIGWPDPLRNYPETTVKIEGEWVWDDIKIESADGTMVVEEVVDIVDWSLTVEYGGKSKKTGNFEYCFLQYLHIESVDEWF